MPEAGEGAQGEGADGSVRGVVRGGQPPSGRGAGAKKAKADAADGKADSGASAAAEQLEQLLSRLNPSLGIMANMLERVCAARKVGALAKNLLALRIAVCGCFATVFAFGIVSRRCC